MSLPIRDPRPAPGAGLRKVLALLSAGLFVVVALSVAGSPVPPELATARQDPQVNAPEAPAPRAVAAATAFLDALNADQKKAAQLEYASDKKPNWSNLPVTFVPRNGVRLADLTKDQRDKAMAVVAAVLSKEGYQKVIDI